MVANVRVKGKRGAFLLIFGSLWLIISLPLMFLAISMFKSEQRFASDGITVKGEVTDRTMEERRTRDKETRRESVSKTYYGHYSFTSKEGVSIKAKDSVSESVWNDLKTGTPIEIQYIPGDPNLNHIARESSFIGSILTGLFGALAFLLGAGCLGYDINKRLFNSRMAGNGMLTQASVTAVRISSLIINDVPQWQIEYSYRDQRGQSHNGRSDYITPTEAGSWKTGDQGKARFDRNKPNKSLWIGRGE